MSVLADKDQLSVRADKKKKKPAMPDYTKNLLLMAWPNGPDGLKKMSNKKKNKKTSRRQKKFKKNLQLSPKNK